MTSRRTFFKTALLGGAAFAAGLQLGSAFGDPRRQRVTLHGFVPAEDRDVERLLATFLDAEPGALPAPSLDVPARWRAVVAGGLRHAAARYGHDRSRAFDVQVSLLERPLPADIMVQQHDRVLDPASGFSRRLLALREDLRGRQAQLAVTCRLMPRPEATAAARTLVVTTERGEHDRIALAGPDRRLELDGPAGKTTVIAGASGARVIAASCRHETCRRLGAIGQPGEVLACAPNRLVLQVETG
jgi:hypothetical protein